MWQRWTLSSGGACFKALDADLECLREKPEVLYDGHPLVWPVVNSALAMRIHLKIFPLHLSIYRGCVACFPGGAQRTTG